MIRPRHIRMAGRYLAHRFRALHPYEVQAQLLNACNLKCVYCLCPEVQTRLLSTEQWIAVIEGLAAHGALRIKFQGGEPTLRRDFGELCATAQRAGLLTAAISNGIEIATRPELLDHLNEVVFSVDAATPEINDRLRGAGSHAAAIRAIELARARALPTYVNMVVGRDNLAEIEPLLAFCESRGARLHAQPVVFGAKYYDDGARHLALTAEQTRAMHRQLAAWKRQGRGLMFAADTYAKVADWPDFGELRVRSSGPSACMAGRFYVHIDANGDVHPCIQHGASLTPKNVITDGLETALLHVQEHDCGTCFAAYLNERKALFALQPRALLEMTRRG